MHRVDLTGTPLHERMVLSATATADALWQRSLRALELQRDWLLPAAALFAWLLAFAFILPVDPDEAVFKVVARGIVDGRWPYRDLFDHKPPLIYAWYLPAGLGASIAQERIIAAAATAASVPVMAVIAQRWLSGRQTRIALWCYCLLLANPYLALGANAEAFMLLPLALSIAAASPWLAGAALGVAVLTKPTAIAFLPVLIMVHKRRAWRSFAGLAVVCALAAVAFVPVWSEFWAANVTFNGELSRYVSGTDRVLVSAYFNFTVLLGALPLWLLALVGFVVQRSKVLWLWALCGVAAAKISGFDFTHYYALVIPPTAILSAIGLDFYLARRRSVPVILAAASLIAIGISVAALWIYLTAPAPYAELVRALDQTDGEVYVLGDRTQVYELAGRTPQRRFFFSIPLVVDGRYRDEAKTGLMACPPAILVVPEQSILKVDWAPEIEALYRQELHVTGAVMYTEPYHVCDNPPSGREIVRPAA